MTVLHLRAPLVCLGIMLGAALGSDVAAQEYRDFHLGSSVKDVTSLTASRPEDIRTLHQRPAVLQEVTWRPRSVPGRPIPDTDPVRDVTFSFVDDKLFRIVVAYEPHLVEGLTAPDMIAALTPSYGAPMAAAATVRPAASSIAGAVLVAAWAKPDVDVRLTREEYVGYRLTVASVALDGVARTARDAAIVIDRREEPARTAARQQAEAAAKRAGDEKTRTTNKELFTP